MSRFHPASPDFYRCLMRGGRMVYDPGTALMVASATMTAAGSIQQGNAAAASYKSQAAADSYNAAVDRQNATAANQVGTERELATRTNNAMQMGEARAAVGEANIGGPQGGTITTSLEQDSVNAELNALGVRYQRDTTAAGYTDSAQQEDFQSQVARMNAGAARTAGYIGAIGSVVKGANTYANALPPGAQTPNSNAIIAPIASPNAGTYQFSSNQLFTPYLSRGGTL